MGIFNRTDNPSGRFAFSDLLNAADKTQPGSNVRAVPLMTLFDNSVRATARVVTAQGELSKIEVEAKAVIDATEAETKATIARLEKHLAEVRSDYGARVEAAHAELTSAELARLEVQSAFIHRQIDEGAFEGVRDFNALVRGKSEGGKS
ncbi:hypothetical protein [Hyphomicrobium sp. DY-1]|uniref:hypothetical protein n=1 Tax=Hyphomicrobium sp. DY-1 TaxID=3075650 RepID=UPI0039C0C8E4